MLRSEATASICLPRMPLTTPESQIRIPTESTQRGHDITIRDLTKNALFRSYGTFAYLLRAHIRNNTTSARGYELSGRVTFCAWRCAVCMRVGLQ